MNKVISVLVAVLISAAIQAYAGNGDLMVEGRTTTAAVHSGGNHYNVLSYSFNGTPTNGIKIKTNIPFTNSTGMPTIFIEGYCFGKAAPIGITLNWYIFNSSFTNMKKYPWGAYNPIVKLSNEGGKVVIFIDDKQYYTRFTVRAFATGMSENNSWFEGWTAADEALTGTNTVTVPGSSYRGARVYIASGAQSLPTSAWTTIQFNGERYDTDSIHDNATNNTRLYVPPGVSKVRLTAGIEFVDNNTTGIRMLSIRKNNSVVAAQTVGGVGHAAGNLNVSTGVGIVAAGDYFEVSCFQDSGSPIEIYTQEYSPFFEMEIIE